MTSVSHHCLARTSVVYAYCLDSGVMSVHVQEQHYVLQHARQQVALIKHASVSKEERQHPLSNRSLDWSANRNVINPNTPPHTVKTEFQFLYYTVTVLLCWDLPRDSTMVWATRPWAIVPTTTSVSVLLQLVFLVLLQLVFLGHTHTPTIKLKCHYTNWPSGYS